MGYWESHRFLEGGIERLSLNHGSIRGKESPQMNAPIAMSPRDAANSIGYPFLYVELVANVPNLTALTEIAWLSACLIALRCTQ